MSVWILLTHPGTIGSRGSKIQRILDRFSAGFWAMVVVVSLLLAGASVWVLYTRLDDRQMDELVRRLESVWQFGADTIRLTFTDRIQGDDKNSRENAAFNVAPKGTLEADAPVVLVAAFEDFVPEVYDEVLPVAPARTMDPTWNPGADDKSPKS